MLSRLRVEERTDPGMQRMICILWEGIPHWATAQSLPPLNFRGFTRTSPVSYSIVLLLSSWSPPVAPLAFTTPLARHSTCWNKICQGSCLSNDLEDKTAFYNQQCKHQIFTIIKDYKNQLMSTLESEKHNPDSLFPVGQMPTVPVAWHQCGNTVQLLTISDG